MADETCPCGCDSVIIGATAIEEEGVLFAGTNCVRRWRGVYREPKDLEKMRRIILGEI